jgi:retron-type reverse transcriptase
MKVYKNFFEKIICLENLFSAWDNFKSGKMKKPDVLKFEWELEKNIFQIYRDLKNKKYKHSPYFSFNICDPKPRNIHKAVVRDRVVHHAIFNVLNPIFEASFIANSFSCRIGKGTHKGVNTLSRVIRKTSKNFTQPCFILKCDIRKFFDSVDHKILIKILERKIKDKDAIWLLKEIVGSFSSRNSLPGQSKGIPLGNLTSQLFANIYLNNFDQFIKHKLKIKNYLRYTDDFVIIEQDKDKLREYLFSIQAFLGNNLALQLHPKKVFIRKYQQGIDFLGYIVLPHYQLVRTKTRRRIFKKFKKRIEEYQKGIIEKQSLGQSLQSYLGVFSHANAYRLSQELIDQFLSLNP